VSLFGVVFHFEEKKKKITEKVVVKRPRFLHSLTAAKKPVAALCKHRFPLLLFRLFLLYLSDLP
jgi:hypothetical protein